MQTYVTVLKTQLDSLRERARQRRLHVVEGVAFAVPDEGVYHAFSEKPPYQPLGNPVPAFFVMKEGSRMPSDIHASLDRMGADIDTPVIVLDERGVEAPVAFMGPYLAEPCVLHVVSPERDAAKRTAGLLENGVLSERRVTIAGLGSFGSAAAVELAKAGVGRFVLIDFDRLEPGNIMRHQCGLTDLGRYKTLAVRDAILARNPSAVVETFESDVNENLRLLRGNAEASDVILCMTDQARSRFNCNEAAVAAKRPAIFARAITRAAGGDVFRYRPGGPCLACLFNQGLAAGEDEVSSVRQAADETPDYAPEGYDKNLVQPGLAADIAPIVQMAVKLALVEIAPRGVEHWDRLREDLAAPFYIWANSRDEIYRDWQPMQYFFNRNSILRWYGVRVERDAGCLTCGMA
jgi:molybdopterin/thiamine biosynthesis adenylyltransferase